MRAFLAPLTIALALALPQDPKPQEPPAPHRPSFFGGDAEATRIRGEILGAWQLTKGELPALGASGGGVAGYALFLDGYMSMEIHVEGNQARFSNNTFFQTGTHRWKIGDRPVLETYGLIGTNNTTEDEEYDYEQPGARREYKVQLDGDRLILERADLTGRLTFMRLGKMWR